VDVRIRWVFDLEADVAGQYFTNNREKTGVFRI